MAALELGATDVGRVEIPTAPCLVRDIIDMEIKCGNDINAMRLGFQSFSERIAKLGPLYGDEKVKMDQLANHLELLKSFLGNKVF